MGKVYYDVGDATDSKSRKKDGMWIPHRKRMYLYWFKFLQEAEQSGDFDVDWGKYRGWGGANYILGTKFDEFWNENWKSLFATKERYKTPKFSLSTSKYSTEPIRLALLCWQKRNSPSLKPNQKSNMTGVAKAVYEYEFGISGEKKPRYGQDEVTAYQLNPNPKFNEIDSSKYGELEDKDKDFLDTNELEDEKDIEERYMEEALPDIQNDIRKVVTRYIRNAKRYMSAVSEGRFPK